MSHVRVGGVPTSASPGELRALFEQCGAVRQLVCHFDAGAAEGTALVAFADADAAREAADLLDSYPLGTSLLEVQPVNPDQFVGRLVSGILAQQDTRARRGREQPGTGPAPSASSSGASATAAGPAGVAVLEAEMRELQLQLRQQADAIKDAAAAAVTRQQHSSGRGAGQGAGADDGWQEAAPRTRRPQQHQQHQQAGPQQRHVAKEAAVEEPNTGLWLGWVGLNVQEDDLARAFSRWGPVQVECLLPADRLADNGKRYKWGVVRFQDVNHAAAAKRATERQHLPGVTADMPLKVVFYKPGHVAKARGKA